MSETPMQPPGTAELPAGLTWSSSECGVGHTSCWETTRPLPDWWRDEFEGTWPGRTGAWRARHELGDAPLPALPVYIPEPSKQSLAPLAQVPAEQIVPTRLCVLVGPAQAGKTCFVASMGRVDASMPTDERKFAFLPGPGMQEFVDIAAGRFTARLDAQEPQRWLRDGAFRLELQALTRQSGTTRSEPLDMLAREVHSAAAFRRARPGPKPLAMLDLSWHDAPPRVCTESCLVLCADSLQPHADLWQEWLPRLVAGWVGAGHNGNGTADRLPFDRVAVLLTKIDRFCTRALAGLVAQEGGNEGAWRRLAPLDLARRIDPLQQVRSALGDSTLQVLRKHLRPGAALAVGLTSAAGFSVDGRQLPISPDAGTADWHYSRWRPFGVREALLFAATGCCRAPLVAATEDNVPDGGYQALSARSVPALLHGLLGGR